MRKSPEQFAAQLIDELDLNARARAGARERGGRAYVALNMISTADGRATLSGRSGAIGDDADKHLFLGLRTIVDGVMAGAGTVRAEGYHRLIRDPAARERRQERGLAPEPLACIVSGRLALDGSVPLLDEPRARVAIVTSSRASLPQGCRAQIEYVRSERDGQLDLAAALRELRASFQIETLLCEGGPHLNANLLAAGLVDELFLSLAPTLAGGDATSESLRIVSGVDLQPPVAMELLSSHSYESHLFLRYKILK
ncbi:MAG: dihydrofolate reductase family protein [Solirubrobacteraceae bacterium]